ncbi:MAG: hypothetical protein ACO3I0_03115 [Limisphaerales bacterium]
MSDPASWVEWVTRVETLNLEIEACLDQDQWERIAALQDQKDSLFRSFDAGADSRPSPGSADLLRLAAQEERLRTRIASVQERLKVDLQRMDASASLSKRLRSSYGSKGPGDANWEQFS